MVDPQLTPVQGSRTKEGWLEELFKLSNRFNEQLNIAAAAIHKMLLRSQDPKVLRETLHVFGEYNHREKAWKHDWSLTEESYASSDDEYSDSSDEESEDL